MTTIHPLGLSDAIADRKIELLDVRSRADFERGHVRGARSVPLNALRAAQLVRERGARNDAPLFLISRRRARASLAAGVLGAAGCVQPVVVEGGMQLWEAQGLPIVQRTRHPASAAAQWLGELVSPHVLRLRDEWRGLVSRIMRARGRQQTDTNGEADLNPGDGKLIAADGSFSLLK